MSLLIIFLSAMVVLGFATERLTVRVYLLITLAAVGTTCLYYFTHRFMT